MTPKNAHAEAPQAGSGVHDLIRQREQLREWIARLDQVKDGAPSRVAERVRADYEDRLRRVTEDLSSHGEEIQRNLEGLRADLAASEETRAHAADALEETRLRHMIGELDDAAWDAARPGLEETLSAADGEVERIRGEVEQLSALAGEIVGAPEPEPVAEVAAEEVAAETPAAPADEPAPPVEEPAAEEPVADVDAFAPAAEAAPEAEVPAAEEAPRGAASAPEPEAASGEDLAAWISEVEAQAGRDPSAEADAAASAAASAASAPAPAASADDGEDRPLAGADADSWDPFAGEFGPGGTTQPGDAASDLPWLDSVDARSGGGTAAGKGAPGWTPGAGSDGLEFLKDLDAAAAKPEEPASADLAEDDLAFLEELDRAISGTTARQQPAAPAPPPAQQPQPTPGFIGADAIPHTPQPASPGAAPRAGGGRLLCKECGALNEPQSWYCEICGSEL